MDIGKILEGELRRILLYSEDSYDVANSRQYNDLKEQSCRHCDTMITEQVYTCTEGQLLICYRICS